MPNFLVKQVNILFTVYLVMLVACSILFYIKIEQLSDSYNLVNHSIRVKLRLERVIINIKSAEAAQRGFLLTEDSSFMESYWQEQKHTKELLFKLDSLTKDNPRQNAMANDLSALVDNRFVLIENVLNNKAFSLSAPTERKLYLQNGTIVMDSIMSVYDNMKNYEDGLQKKREAANNKNVSLTPVYILGIAIFSLIILIICQVMLTRLNKGVIKGGNIHR